MQQAPSRNPAASTQPAPSSRILGSGEMADLVRAFDWSTTPLGPIESWSRELLTMVNLTLCSPAPARTMWGPDFILIYNDAYRFIPGKRHPAALGKPARHIYKESWHVVGPLLERAYATGESCHHKKLQVPIETQKGLKNFYFNYSFNPVHEEGKVAGIFGPIHDVTEEVQTHSRLQESEDRLARILQSIGDAVIVSGTDGSITHMNPIAEDLTGWPFAEALGQPLSRVFRIADETSHAPVESPVDHVNRLDDVTKLPEHTVLLRRDGSEIPIDDSGAPIRDDHDKITGTVLVFRDISRRRSTERERDAVSRELNQVLATTTDGVLSIDRNWRIRFANRCAEQTLAVTGDLSGRHFWDTFSGTIYPGSPYVWHYNRAMNERIAGSFVEHYGEPLNAWFSVVVQPADNGIILFFRDVTEQRREAEALRESEARLRAMYGASLEYIGLTTPEGIVLQCNDAALEFAGSRREQLVGKHFADGPWWAHTPGMSDLVRQWITRAAQGESIRSEVPLNRSDDETMIFDFSLTPARNSRGAVMYLVPEFRDITELKRAVAALMQSEKLAAVGRLASSIAHEINNPLESVTNLIYLASASAISPDTRAYLEAADNEIRRISLITNQTLRFHRQPSNPRPISAADLFSSVIGIFGSKLRRSHIEVALDLPASQPIVCFEGDIRQVLNNLVGNALDAMPTGGRMLIRSRVSTHWPTNRRGLTLTVADTGEGMPPRTVAHIFEPFFTTKGVAGTGLGLWVSQEIVQRHEGVLRVRSSQRKPGSGTVFTLFLPFDRM